MSALAVRGARKHYRSGDSLVRALDGVTLTARRGEVVGIVGPSGSGKSTMLLIAGLIIRPDAGSVEIDGIEVNSASADIDRMRDLRRRHIGFVAQKPNLIPFLTAQENVALALSIDDVRATDARAHAGELLHALGLGHRLRSKPMQLSGGEQQRVAIARAVANAPALILADEPTAALDGERGRQAMGLFRQIAEERRAAVVVVTHDPRNASQMDNVFTFEDGRIVSDNPRGSDW